MKEKKIIFYSNHYLFIGYSLFSLFFLSLFICSIVYIIIPFGYNNGSIFIVLCPFLLLLLTTYILIKFTLRFVIINRETILYKERGKIISSHKTAEITKIRIQYFYREGKFILIYWGGDYIKLSYSLRRLEILEKVLHIKAED